MKIFLDVGAHAGQTTSAVLSSGHEYDKIYCFEPQRKMLKYLNLIASDKVIINDFGLFNQDCKKKIYWEKRRIGGGVYKDKFTKEFLKADECEFRSASKWFAENIKDEYEVTLKINTEGSECDIMDDLFATREARKIDRLMIDFDVRKIESQKHREKEIREKIKELGIKSVFLLGTEEESLMTWREINRYLCRREEWVHYWLNKLFLIKL